MHDDNEPVRTGDATSPDDPAARGSGGEFVVDEAGVVRPAGSATGDSQAQVPTPAPGTTGTHDAPPAPQR